DSWIKSIGKEWEMPKLEKLIFDSPIHAINYMMLKSLILYNSEEKSGFPRFKELKVTTRFTQKDIKILSEIPLPLNKLYFRFGCHAFSRQLNLSLKDVENILGKFSNTLEHLDLDLTINFPHTR